jgi:geranylgeranylglycerol-phosphate geranylgeranyltransferase
MGRIRAVLQLVRADHDVMLALGVVIGYAVSGGLASPDPQRLLFSAMTAFLVGAGAFALNDYYDLEIDRRNRRTDRPLVRGDISPRAAVAIFIILFSSGLACSSAVSLPCFAIALVTGALAVSYDVWVKRLKLLGNFYIAYMMAIPFVFGGVAASSVPGSTLVLAAMAYLSGFGREVMKDIMDLPGDMGAGVRSFPACVGERASCFISSGAYIAAVALSPIPFLLGPEPYLMNPFYIVPVLVADSLLLFTAASLTLEGGRRLRSLRRVSLAAMMLGLVGFLLAGFIR